jgi:hypothetical protein
LLRLCCCCVCGWLWGDFPHKQKCLETMWNVCLYSRVCRKPTCQISFKLNRKHGGYFVSKYQWL